MRRLRAYRFPALGQGPSVRQPTASETRSGIRYLLTPSIIPFFGPQLARELLTNRFSTEEFLFRQTTFLAE